MVEYQGHFGVAAYKVADKIGDIMVFFDNQVSGGPAAGTHVIIRGNLEEIGLAGMKMGVFIREQQRLFSSGEANKIDVKNNRL